AGAAALGAWRAVRQAITLPPAEAMRPEPPTRYRQTLVERFGLEPFLAQPARMVLRSLERRPVRSLASVIGIACSGGLLIIGLFLVDSIELILDVAFNVTQRQDVTVSFVEPRSAAALHEVTRLSGVDFAEPARSVPVRLRAEHRSRQTSIQGLVGDPRLQRIVDVEYQVATPPSEGLLLSSAMARILAVERGDPVIVEVLEGGRPVRQAIVTDLVDEFLGTAVYMDADALHRLMREGQVLTGAYLQIDSAYESVLYRQLKNLPSVAGVSLRSAAVRTFREQMGEFLGVFIAFTILFASIITIGVVYNTARIILSERSRELASLRVLGFTRGEISSILLGELAVITALAVPLGLVFGRGFAGAMVTAFETELYRFPLVISMRTYAVSALVVLLAATLSGLLVRRKLDHLDLVEVLKSRE
ncbi:MAG: ABC transporter permease, partial [Acidobacteriota bacterium]